MDHILSNLSTVTRPSMMGAPSAAERSHPTAEVRGRSREDPLPKGRWPRGVTPHLRSGAAAESTRRRRHRNGREELPASEVRGSDERSYPASEVRGSGGEEIRHAPSPRPGAAARRSNPMPEARGGGQEDQPHFQGAVAARAQEGLEELSHIEGHEGRR